MKKSFLIALSLLLISPIFASPSFALGMMGGSNISISDSDISSQQAEESEGKKFMDNLNAKSTTCSQLKDADFEKIGEYYMGLSIGDTSRHIAMNSMIKRMMGDKGEEQMHSTMGKRLSGCDTNAWLSAEYSNYSPMMDMMIGGQYPSNFNGFNNKTIMGNYGGMGWGFGGGFGSIYMILWWVLIIGGIFMFIKWSSSQSGNEKKSDKSALDILKERYAMGEIDKKEFEDRKKDLI